jgi:hypothetical protein
VASFAASSSVHTWSLGGVAGTTTWNALGPARASSRIFAMRSSPPRVWLATIK